MQKLPHHARMLAPLESSHPQSYPQLLWITASPGGRADVLVVAGGLSPGERVKSLVSPGGHPYNSRPTFEACPDAAAMKEAIHPNYKQITVTCSCGNTFETRSTLGQDLQIEVCSSCHPFYTGKQKIVDTGGRVDRFRKKYAAKA
jgi:large subunit ribosomal protein L31